MTETSTRLTSARTAELSWEEGRLIRGGRPYRMLAGAIHYFRVHPEQWEDRLRRLAAMGANTVDTYVAWNFHERTEGDARFDGWRDIERFVGLAGDIGLDVLLRPSPYICAEWSNGGLPSWLTARVRAVRTSDPDFLAAVDRWYDELIPRIVPLQASHGGPVVAVQVENEYGSFGSDRAYLTHLAEGLRSRGVVEMLTTADGITGDMVVHGSVPGALPTFTFGTGVGRAQELLPDGAALMCSELWGGWFDHWGERHHVRSADSMITTVDELLGVGGSVSLYMAHGGTNFGLWNGANHDGVLQSTVTSYDSDAPIAEDGTVGAKFEALRGSFAPFHDGELPPLPPSPPFQPEQDVDLIATSSLASAVQGFPRVGPRRSPRPLTFEELGVEDGLVVYEATAQSPSDGVLSVDGLHDRATVLVDGRRAATLERDGQTSVALPGPARSVQLTIVVESLGRINYGPYTGEHKGILHGVLIGSRFVNGWTHRALPARVEPSGAPGADGLACAEVEVVEPADAWLSFPEGAKGMVWLNDFLLGRYWEVGPTQSLYAPAPLWRTGRNEIRVLDLERLGTRVEVRQRPVLGPTEEFIGS